MPSVKLHELLDKKVPVMYNGHSFIIRYVDILNDDYETTSLCGNVTIKMKDRSNDYTTICRKCHEAATIIKDIESCHS